MEKEKVKLDEADIENVAGGINTVIWKDDQVEPLNPDTPVGRPSIVKPKPAPNPFVQE